MRNRKPFDLKINVCCLALDIALRQREFVVEYEIDDLKIQIETQVISSVSSFPFFDPLLCEVCNDAAGEETTT